MGEREGARCLWLMYVIKCLARQSISGIQLAISTRLFPPVRVPRHSSLLKLTQGCFIAIIRNGKFGTCAALNSFLRSFRLITTLTNPLRDKLIRLGVFSYVDY